MNLYTPERTEGESFSDYKARRAAANRAVRESQRNPNHGLVGARQKYRDSMRESGAMGKRTRASDALMAAWASKRVTKTVLRDEHGAYTLTGSEYIGVDGETYRPRRKWLAGISAQRGY